MEAQRALESCDQPPAIHYLSVHCDILALVLSSGSKEVTKVPLRCFLQHVGSLASWLTVASSSMGLVWQWGVWKSSGRDTAWHLSWWSLSSMDWDSHPGRAWVEQRCPQRGQGVFFIVEVLALAIKLIQAHPPPLNRWELVSYVIWSPKTKNEAGCYQNSITSHFNRLARLSQPLLSAIL